METNNNRRPLRKGVVIIVITVLCIAIMVGIWFASKAFYANQPLTISVPASAKVYLSDGEFPPKWDGESENPSSWKFYDVVDRFVDTPVEELIDSGSFPVKLETTGFITVDGSTYYFVESKWGGATYLIELPENK